jgi:NADPH-dependent curcumin reductase CurA
MPTNRRIVLASRPEGAASTSNFRLEEAGPDRCRPGQVLVRNLWLSARSYMRGRMTRPLYTPRSC